VFISFSFALLITCITKLFVLYKIFWICQEAILIFGQESDKVLQKGQEATQLSKKPLATDTQQEASMNKCINFQAFMRPLIDEEKQVKKAAEIMKGLLEAQSPRMTNIAEKMSGRSERNYKTIQRFLQQVK